MPNNFVVRRVKRDSATGCSDTWWLLFRVGEIRSPLCVLTDFDMDDILEQVAEERGDTEDEG